MTKLDKTETIEKCKEATEVCAEYYKTECDRMFQQILQMEVIIEALIEEIKRRPKYV